MLAECTFLAPRRSTLTSKETVSASDLSTSAIICLISAFFTWKPRARNAALSSLMSIEPLPSVSNSWNASWISSRASSSRAGFAALRPPPAREGG